MGLMEIDLGTVVTEIALVRPAILLEAARQVMLATPAWASEPARPGSRQERRRVEAELEAKRRERAPGYRPSRHVEALAHVLVDVAAEAGERRRAAEAGPAR